ncbi:MAG TPA: alanine/glycine:cation symporter family protein [Sphingobacteriaceae bacterium]|nr:alanine/glycine:cation symporter family protein [Sphingobacteriaceae bacterium]
MEKIVTLINDVVWSNALIILCASVGIYFSVVTRFLQVRYLKEMIRLLRDGASSQKGVSSFQAFSIAVSGRVGTGNIAGVATAIAMGGPGAVFWMWAIAFLGSASAFIEATLGQIYKTTKDGQYRGGPAFYIEKGLGIKWYAILFAVATLISTALLLPGVQSNSIAVSVKNAFEIPVEITGGIITVLLGLIIFGGVKRIGKVAEIVVPFMAAAYILMSVIIIFINITEVPSIFALIFKSAFALEPAFGGIFGMAIAWGVKRGIYSNEAGQGTAPHAAAAAEVSHPAKQGLVQAFSVYVDTFFICTATALMILFTNQYNVINPEGGFIVENIPGSLIGPEYTQLAISTHFPSVGSGFVAISLLFFAFTTLMAYYYIAETNLSYLNKSSKRKYLVWCLRALILVATFYGSVKTAELAWGLGDIGVGLMAWINLIAIILLRKPALRCFKDYQEQRKVGKNPVFSAKKLGIKNADEWD